MHASEIEKDARVGVRQMTDPRSLWVGPVVQVDGTDKVVPCRIGNSEGCDLALSEEQARELHRKLGTIISFWDEIDPS